MCHGHAVLHCVYCVSIRVLPLCCITIFMQIWIKLKVGWMFGQDWDYGFKFMANLLYCSVDEDRLEKKPSRGIKKNLHWSINVH